MLFKSIFLLRLYIYKVWGLCYAYLEVEQNDNRYRKEKRCIPHADNRAALQKQDFWDMPFDFGLFSVLIIVHRLVHYVYEFDPKYSPIDYGRFNILSFFTVQSNIFVCFYLLVTAFAVFGNVRAQKIAFSPMLGALVTTYILITGVVYCCGIPLAFTTPYQWDTPTHSMLGFIQVYHHMIIPPLMVLL